MPLLSTKWQVIIIKKEQWNILRYLNFAFSFGITMTASLLIGYYGGTWLDQRFNSSPFLMLAGVLLGVATSFYALLQELRILDTLKTYKPNKLFEDEDKE